MLNKKNLVTDYQKKLFAAVTDALGTDDDDEIEGTLSDVCRGGADAGWPGFTYYSDTCAFYSRNKAAIVKLAEQLANDLGEDVLSMVAGFRCLNKQYKPADVAKVLYGQYSAKKSATTDADMIANALAWFALEEVAHIVCDN
jgi:hypothetical protein